MAHSSSANASNPTNRKISNPAHSYKSKDCMRSFTAKHFPTQKNRAPKNFRCAICVAGEQGIEPWTTILETVSLPLAYSPICILISKCVWSLHVCACGNSHSGPDTCLFLPAISQLKRNSELTLKFLCLFRHSRGRIQERLGHSHHNLRRDGSTNTQKRIPVIPFGRVDCVLSRDGDTAQGCCGNAFLCIRIGSACIDRDGFRTFDSSN